LDAFPCYDITLWCLPSEARVRVTRTKKHFWKLWRGR